MGIFFAIVMVVIIFFIGRITFLAIAKTEKIATSKAAYHASLETLTGDPTNPRLRKATMEFGRVYSNIARNNNGVALFDEVALMNDINAACGGITAISNSGNPPTPPDAGLSIQDRLTKLRQLKEHGFISESEYEKKRQQLISEV